MDKALNLIGLAKKAGRTEIGEEPVAAAVRAKDARALLLAADAAENSVRRARRFAETGGCPLLQLPASKDALGRAVGRTSCAMLAVTDVGFAAAIAEKLAALDPAQYGEEAQMLRVKADRAVERRREQRQHEKNVRTGKYRPSAPKTSSPAGENAAAPRRKADKKPRSPAQKREKPRYTAARPVKKGKGSFRREKP